MALTKFPNGISSFGVPQLGGVSIPSTTGKYFFVDSVTGSNGNSGADSIHPFATIDFAVGQCTANKGDIIIVMPGHNETITSATSLVVDVAGVSIIGLGVNQSRPTLDFDNTAGSIEMDAANCRLSNIVLRASVSAIVVGINVDANDVTLDNLEFTFEATGDDFILMVDVDAFDRCTITDCRFFGELAVAGATSAVRLDDSHNFVFQRNMIVGSFTTAFNSVGALSQTCVISDNLMYNADTSVNNGFEMTVASTGLFARNIIGTLYATGVADLLDPGSMLCAENYAVNAIDESGIKLPATTSA